MGSFFHIYATFFEDKSFMEKNGTINNGINFNVAPGNLILSVYQDLSRYITDYQIVLCILLYFKILISVAKHWYIDSTTVVSTTVGPWQVFNLLRLPRPRTILGIDNLIMS